MSQTQSLNSSEISVTISTRDRYDRLAHCIQSILFQTYKPYEILIFDDSDKKIDLRSYPFFLNLLQSLNRAEIKWKVIIGKGGQVLNHNEAINMCETSYLFRCDDDNLLEPPVLENLYNIIKKNNKIGCVAPCVIHPDCIFPREVTSPKIEDVLFKYAVQFCEPENEITEVQHLYSTFLSRVTAIKNCYPIDLSRIGHTEESQTTYAVYQKGYKLLVDKKSKVHHFRCGTGGIRSFQHQEWWNSDTENFKLKLKNWGVKVNEYYGFVTDGAIGDSLILKKFLPKIREKHKGKKLILGCVYPSVFEDEKDIELISIHSAKILLGDIQRFNPYMIGSKFEGAFSIFDCVKKCYNIE